MKPVRFVDGTKGHWRRPDAGQAWANVLGPRRLLRLLPVRTWCVAMLVLLHVCCWLSGLLGVMHSCVTVRFPKSLRDGDGVHFQRAMLSQTPTEPLSDHEADLESHALLDDSPA